jgi:MSHA pilin protein MshD
VFTLKRGLYMFSSPQRGATLVELVITIVIISLALVGVLAGINSITARSADPMISAQAGAIAEAYLEEVLLRTFKDPEGGATDCNSSPGDDSGETRASFDDIDDYNGLSEPARLQANAASSLAGYTVAVRVECAALDGIAAGSAAKVTVSVSHGGIQQVVLWGYRADY